MYHYGGNNPIKYTDPTGEAIAVIPFIAPTVIAGAKAIGAWLASLFVVGTAATAVGVTLDAAIDGSKENDSSPVSTDGIVPNNPEPSKEIGNHDTKDHKKSKSGSGKEKSNDIPTWAEGQVPYIDESGKEFAKRLMDEKYGKDNYEKGPNSEFNKLKKWGDRGFE